MVGALAFCTLAGTARASFPGKNGAIVYGWSGTAQYRGATESSSIRTVGPRTGSVHVLRDCPLRPENAFGHPDCQVWGPRYSPEGLRIAITTARFSYPPGGPWESQPGLSLMSRDGTLLEERSTAESYLRLAWSPAGDQFLLQRRLALPGGGLGPNAIFLAGLDGRELMQVTPEWTQAPDWSSTGDIAFGRYDHLGCLPACEDIFVTRLGGTPRRLTYRGGSSPSWPPHGTKLTFVRAGDINLIGRDGRGLRRLTRRGGYSPAWSPDGKWIAFIRDGDIYVVRTTGRSRRRLVDEPGLELDGPSVDSIDWQPLRRP